MCVEGAYLSDIKSVCGGAYLKVCVEGAYLSDIKSVCGGVRI